MKAMIWRLVLLGLLSTHVCRAVTYATITGVDVSPLTNGVQLTVKADGVIAFNQGGGGGGRSDSISLAFPGARSGLKSNFINIAQYPVSYVQVQTPQNARDGVGISMKIALFTPSTYQVTPSADQLSVIITVDSDRTLSPGGGSAASDDSSDKLPAAITVLPDHSVNLRAVNADIHELLARLAHLTGINIVVDGHVNRKISLSLAGMPADDIIQSIASGYGLALSKVENVYMVSEGVPTDLATYHLSQTESFRMNYIQAQQASGLLPTFLFQYLHVNNGQNAVVVTAPSQMLTKIQSDLAQVDVQPPLLEIEALAVELTDTSSDEESLGLSMHRGDRTTTVDSVLGMLQYQTIGALPYSFAANLRALVSKGKAQIRANPRLAVVNGQSASLFIGDQRYIQVQFNAYGGTQTSIQGVTPWTGGNGEITTRIQPEVSNISEIDLQSGLPILSDRKADTTVRVKDGETIVIGGLVQKQTYLTRRKIPVLGDIPLIGSLFRSHEQSEVESELVLFITPHILDAQGRLTNASPERTRDDNDLMQEMNPPEKK